MTASAPNSLVRSVSKNRSNEGVLLQGVLVSLDGLWDRTKGRLHHRHESSGASKGLRESNPSPYRHETPPVAFEMCPDNRGLRVGADYLRSISLSSPKTTARAAWSSSRSISSYA